MGRHSIRGVRTGEELNVCGKDSSRHKQHRYPGGNVCLRFKELGDGRTWCFWPTDFRPERNYFQLNKIPQVATTVSSSSFGGREPLTIQNLEEREREYASFALERGQMFTKEYGNYGFGKSW